MKWGGYRPGSGRPKGSKNKKKSKAGQLPLFDNDESKKSELLTPLTYMLGVINDEKADSERRDKLAIAAAPFFHHRNAGLGKKEEKQIKAKKITGKFAPVRPPYIDVVK